MLEEMDSKIEGRLNSLIIKYNLPKERTEVEMAEDFMNYVKNLPDEYGISKLIKN